MTTPSSPRGCSTCLHDKEDYRFPACASCTTDENYDATNWVAAVGHNSQPTHPSGSLPDDAAKRNEYPMADGLLDYFPNALAEVARLSHLATQQHHPDQPMHWDRSKSTDHRNKIMRHLIDTDTVDDKGIDHWAMVCWRALAGYQTYLEAKHGLRPSRASKNLPTN